MRIRRFPTKTRPGYPRGAKQTMTSLTRSEAVGQISPAWGDTFLNECLGGSAISPDLFEAAIGWIEDTGLWEPNRALGHRVSVQWQTRPPHNFGALACFTQESGELWQAKPERPMLDRNKTRKRGRDVVRKYETPKGAGSQAYLPPVPASIRQQVSQRYGVELPLDGGSFWDWVAQHPSIPIVLTEGGKKALSLLSDGFVGISLYGVNGGYRTLDGDGKKTAPTLIPDLARFMVPGRPVVLAFDQDAKPETQERVRLALLRFGGLLMQHGCNVSIASWQATQGKGIDDLAVAAGRAAVEAAITSAQPFSQWKQYRLPKAQRLLSPTYRIDSRYVSEGLAGLDLTAKLLVIKSPQNTGKTTLLEGWVKHWQAAETPVMMLTYRHSLEVGYGARFQIPTREEMIQYRESIGIEGFTCCIHSLRPDSAARFTWESAPVGPVVLDEVRSLLTELTSSSLVIRGKVLPQFCGYLRRCSAAGYPIIAMDAHATSLEVEALAAIIGAAPEDVCTIENTVKPWSGRQVFTAENAAIAVQFRQQLSQSSAPLLVTTTSQKPGSTYGSVALEKIALSERPGAKVLRVDSQTTKLKEHPAAKFMALLESQDRQLALDFLRQFDVVIFSPCIEAGVSLDIYGHFAAQLSFTSGNLAAENCVQQWLRLRDANVPLYAGFLPDGRGNAKALKRSHGFTAAAVEAAERQKTRGNLIELVAPSGLASPSPTALLSYWYGDAARGNAAIATYQDLVCCYLAEMGCEVSALETDSDETEGEKQQRSTEKRSEAAAAALNVASAEAINLKQAKELEQAKYNSEAEQLSLQRHAAEQRYQAKLNPGLALLDAFRPAFFNQAQLAYYLTMGREHLKQRDQAKAQALADSGPVFGPDLNRKLIGAKVRGIEAIGLGSLLDRAGEFIANDDPLLLEIERRLTYCTESIRAVLGVALDDGWGVVRRINHLAKQLLGQKILVKAGTRGSRGERRRVVYEVAPLPDATTETPLELLSPELDTEDADTLRSQLDQIEQAARPWLFGQWLDRDTQAQVEPTAEKTGV